MLKFVPRSFNICTRYITGQHFEMCGANAFWQSRLCKKTSARNLASGQQQQPNHIKSSGNETLDEFMMVFPDVVNALLETTSFKSSPVVAKRFSKICYYNLPAGKKIRGLSVVNVFKILKKSRTYNKADVKLACILGWCVEMEHTAILIQDDIMDQSSTRRGLPCWYTLPDVGLQAINDSLMLENSAYSLLEKYFSDHTSYVSIIELFRESMLRTSLGQASDMSSVICNKPQFETFSIDSYTSMVVNKSGYYTFILPVLAALHLSGTYSSTLHKQILPLFERMGLAFQSLDDFLDSFGNHEKFGKSRMDIRSGKCTWLAVKTLELATENQKELFQHHYGRPEIDSEKEILNLYKELKLPQVHSQFEEELIQSIRKGINEVPNENNVKDALIYILDSFIRQFHSFKM